MHTSNVIPFAPALERHRRATAGVSLVSWHNDFRDGIEDLWAGPFRPAGSGEVIPLRVA